MSSPFGDNDYYALLGLEATASEKDIKKAYRKTALKYHPDKVGPDDEEANRLFILLTKAVEVLSDPAQRAKYDEAHAARVARQRTLEQVGKERRDMIAQLEQREDQFRRRQAEASAAAVRKAEVERLREEGIRRLREMEQQDAAAASSAASMDVDGAETGDGAAATAVIVQWTGTGAAAVTAAAPSVQELATLFGVFGEVEAVQRMKSGTAAVVFFKRRESAEAAIQRAPTTPALKGFKVSLESGLRDSAVVRPAATSSKAMSSAASAVGPVPSASDETLAFWESIRNGPKFGAFEDDEWQLLMKMAGIAR